MRYLTALLLLLSVVSFRQQVIAEPYRIGVSAPFSGGGAGWGNDLKNVLLFANDTIADGRYSFLFEDDRCDPKTALTIARKFIAIDRIREVFHLCGQTVMASAKVYREGGVTVMAPLATPSRISELGIFRTSLSDSFAAEKLAKYIAEENSSIFVLTEENDYPVSFLQDFLRSAKVLKLDVKNESYLPQQLDFKAQLLRLKSQEISALFLNTQTEEALGNLVRQLKEINYAPTLYGAYLPGSSGFLKVGGMLAEGLVFVDFPEAQDLLNADGQQLYREFTAKYGALRGWSFIFPAAYEAMRVVHLGISSGKPFDQFLKTTEFKGIFGPYRFDEHGDIVGLHHVLRVIRNGKSEKLTG